MTKPSPTAYRRAVLDAHRNKRGVQCQKCRRRFPDPKIDIDHRTPSSKGGSDDPSNLQPLCKDCHGRKTRREANPVDWATPLIGGGAAVGGLVGVGPLVAPTVRGVDPFTLPNLYTALAPLDWSTIGAQGVAYAAAGAVAGVACWAVPKAAAWWLKDRPTTPNTKTTTGPSKTVERVTSAVNELLPTGRTVTVSERDGGHLVDYTGTGFPDHNDEKRVELIEKVASKLGGRLVGQWDTANDRVLIRARARLPEFVPHPGFDGPRPWHILPFAAGPDGPVAFDLKVTSHLLITGATNSGKTSVMRSLVAALADSAARGEVELMIGDPKRSELIGFRGWPGVREVASNPEDLWDIPLKVEAEMERRYAAFDLDRTPLESHRPWVFLLDEFEHFSDVMTDMAEELDAKGKPRERTTQKRPPSPIGAVRAVLRLARRCNIHVIVGTQRPDADFMGGRARDQMEGRCAVGRLNQQASQMAFGSSLYGRDVPSKVKGRATVQVGEGEPIECQTWWTPDPLNGALTDDDRAILDRLSARRVDLMKSGG